ncbi:MAG: ice-binding family protein [Candidatus Dormibacteraeota bacterium]|nr:ice-binding family protein [Candidatus Dormibacteraeota bacterium]
MRLLVGLLLGLTPAQGCKPMKRFFLLGGSSAVLMSLLVLSSTATYAATSPGLGMAASFGILSSTYTNTASGTTINADLGYTTAPALTPTVNGATYSPPSSKYSTAGTDQGSALTNLNSQPCTFTFPAGAVDLATDTSHGTLGTYTPGVYCTAASSAASIGAAGITLSGSGAFIFRVNGALTTVSNSAVRFAGGASACNVFWTPTAATTLGANSGFVGTDIDGSGITIGRTVTWTGQALAFGGTVSTTNDTISVATCTAATPTPGPMPSVPPSGASGSTPGGFPTIPAGLSLLLGGSLVVTTVWARRRRA